MSWYHSLKFYIVAALAFQLVVLIFIAGFSLYQLDLRKHDYAILNLAGQLRVISQVIVEQSSNYQKAAPRDYASYDRDLSLYNKDLHKNVKDYDSIMNAFERRILPAELIASKQPLYCNWDEQSISQLDRSTETWRQFKTGLQQALGDDKDEPKLEYAAQYIVANGERIQQSSARLTNAFQAMMEAKLDTIHNANIAAIIGFVMLNLLIILVFVFRVFRPLDQTRRGFEKVSNGHLDYQVPVASRNEIGILTQSFNSLTKRVAALFQLTDHVHQASNLDDALRFFYQEFQYFLPLDWTALIRNLPDENSFILERMYSDMTLALHEDDRFPANDFLINRTMQNRQPVNLHKLNQDSRIADDPFLQKLSQHHIQSLLVMPLESMSRDSFFLLLASTQPNAYQKRHLELMSNISAQLSHSLDKTIGMEGLVISAIEGLAKLAESRDPETGDHLTRMSLYSAVIAEQLGNNSPYQAQVSTAYVRDVHRFAPMHDIGKVGIEDNILLKLGRLTDEEKTEMKKHPLIGAQVLERCEQQMNALGHSVFKTGIEIAGCHHEKYDGTGYPAQLSGEDIPLSARIVSVADVFDALTSKRPYKQAWSVEQAIEVMKEQAGKHFDPVVIEALENTMPRILEIYNKHKHI